MPTDKTIGELDAIGGAPDDNDLLEIEAADGSASYRATVANLASAAAFASIGGGAVDSVNGETGTVIIDAGDIDIVDSGTLYTATEVEAALAEVMTAHNAHLADTSDAHDASAVSVADAGSLITATAVEAALQEIFNGSFAVNTNATTGSTETLTLAPAHKMTMDQNCTFTFPTPATNGHTFQLWLLGAFTPTFPAAVDWHGSAAPTYVNDSLYGFTTLDGGTTWLGALIASNLG
jgi:hypothetical protein